jgi:hypothetical protein
MQTDGVYTAEIRQSQRPHQQNGFQYAIVVPTPTGTVHGRFDNFRLCLAARQFAYRNVFHQWYGGKCAEALKKVARKIKTLVPACDTGNAAAQIDCEFNHSVHQGFVVETQSKVPPAGIAWEQPVEVGWQNTIGVKKQ